MIFIFYWFELKIGRRIFAYWKGISLLELAHWHHVVATGEICFDKRDGQVKLLQSQDGEVALRVAVRIQLDGGSHDTCKYTAINSHVKHNM